MREKKREGRRRREEREHKRAERPKEKKQRRRKPRRERKTGGEEKKKKRTRKQGIIEEAEGEVAAPPATTTGHHGVPSRTTSNATALGNYLLPTVCNQPIWAWAETSAQPTVDGPDLAQPRRGGLGSTQFFGIFTISSRIFTPFF